MAISRGYFEEDKNTLYLDSNKNQSMLKFKSDYEKRKIENLQKLAGICVDFTFLRPIIPFLCKLPLTKFYHFLFYVHLGYSHKIKSQPVKIKTLLKEIPIYFNYFKNLVFKS